MYRPTVFGPFTQAPDPLPKNFKFESFFGTYKQQGQGSGGGGPSSPSLRLNFVGVVPVTTFRVRPNMPAGDTN